MTTVRIVIGRPHQKKYKGSAVTRRHQTQLLLRRGRQSYFQRAAHCFCSGKKLEKREEKALGIKVRGSGVGWVYEWAGNGVLKSVTLPQGSVVSFNYDPLGRRVGKGYKGKVTRWLWDGNVPLREWSYKGVYPPPVSVDTDGRMVEAKEEMENLVTWVYEEGGFVPCGKITSRSGIVW